MGNNRRNKKEATNYQMEELQSNHMDWDKKEQERIITTREKTSTLRMQTQKGPTVKTKGTRATEMSHHH